MPISRCKTNFERKSNGIKRRNCIAMLLFSCFFGQALLYAQPQQVMALGLPLVSGKQPAMILPLYEKLFQGAGPTTNDNSSQPSTQAADLSPLTLQDSAERKAGEAGSSSNDNNDTTSGAVLKSTVSTTDYVPHQGDPAVLEARSINKKKGHGHKADKGTLSEQAAAVKIGPLPLLETDNEAQKKADTIISAENGQLADLWEATLIHNPDIQFVIQKFQPTSNHAHMANILTRMLSTAAFGGLGAMSMMSPNVGTFAAASMGGSMMQTALGITQSKADKKAKLTNEETTIMYNMVRATCDKLVACYRGYKKCWSSLTRASVDLQDLQAMVADARAGQDSAKQLEMEYTVRKQQRDLDCVADDLRGHRQSLIDLAGAEAVDKLDKQLAEEGKIADGAAIPQQPGEQTQNQSKTDCQLAQDKAKMVDKVIDIDSADNLASMKNKSQTASALCPQS